MTAKKRDTSEDGYNKTFPRILRELIEQNNTTIQAVANQIGITRQAVSQYCNGETQPNGETLLKIADFFGVSCDYLLRGISAENIEMNEQLGLSEKAIEVLKAIKRLDALYGFPENGCSKLISDTISLFEGSAQYLALLELADLKYKNEFDDGKVSTIADLKNRLICAGIGNPDTLEIITRCIDAVGFQILSPLDVRNDEIAEILDYFKTVISVKIFTNQKGKIAEKIADALLISSKFENLRKRFAFDVDIEKNTIFDIEKGRRDHADDNETE